jgi:hypothetical protein
MMRLCFKSTKLCTTRGPHGIMIDAAMQSGIDITQFKGGPAVGIDRPVRNKAQNRNYFAKLRVLVSAGVLAFLLAPREMIGMSF